MLLAYGVSAMCNNLGDMTTRNLIPARIPGYKNYTRITSWYLTTKLHYSNNDEMCVVYHALCLLFCIILRGNLGFYFNDYNRSFMNLIIISHIWKAELLIRKLIFSSSTEIWITELVKKTFKRKVILERFLFIIIITWSWVIFNTNF